MTESITLQIENMDAVRAAIRKYGKDAEREIGNAVKAVALAVNGDVKKAIQRGPKTGIIYTRGSIEHQASAPGEAPATDTGTLVSSIYYEQDNPLEATVGSRLAYAYALEFGTLRMEPRPSWIPATEANRPNLEKFIETALQKVAP